MRDLFVLFSTSAAKRYTFKQRTKFINYISSELMKNKIPCFADKYNEESQKCINLIVGDINKAKRIIIAGYDTPNKVLLNKFDYYPLDSNRNRKEEKVGIVLNLLLSVLLIACCGALIYLSQNFSMNMRIVTWAAIAILMLLIYKLVKGYANYYNFNKNTAGITVLYKLAQLFSKEDNKTALIFCDKVATSYAGYKRAGKALSECNFRAEVLILDCIADGENVYIAHGENNNKYCKLIKNLEQKVSAVEVKLSKNEVDKSPISIFNNGAMLFCGRCIEGEYIVKDVRTGKDSVCDLNKLRAIFDVLNEYCK